MAGLDQRLGAAAVQKLQGKIAVRNRPGQTGAIAKRRLGLLDRRDQLVDFERLVQVVDRAEPNGRFQVFLVGIAAEKQDLQRWFFVAQDAGQRHAVHFRHADVTDQDVRIERPHQIQCFRPVGRFGNDFDVQQRPVDRGPDPLARRWFVVSDDHFVHHGILPRYFSGKTPLCLCTKVFGCAYICWAGRIQTLSVSGNRSRARQITAPVPIFLAGIFSRQRKAWIMDFFGSLVVFTSTG